MRPALLVVASLLAGCREGVELEILADSTTTRVEVFLAAHDPLVDVTELAPENAEHIAGIAFPRNLTADGAIEAPFIATVGADHRARLELQPDGDHTVLRALIAVGFDANGTLVSAAVLNDVDVSATPLRVVVELAPVSGQVLEAGVASAQVWGRPEYAYAGCVGITTVDPATGIPATQFIVTEGDPDCDGLTLGTAQMPAPADTECDDRAYRGSVPVSGTVLHTDAQQTCRPFADVCQDGAGLTPGTPEPLCLPDALCLSTCASGDVTGCIAALRGADATFAHLRCVVPLSFDINLDGQLPLCTGLTEGPSDLANLFPGGVECKDIRFATVSAGTTALDLRPELVLASGTPNGAAASIATVDVTTAVPTTSACRFVLRPETDAINNTDAPPQVVVIRTDGTDKLLLPVRMVRSQGCATGSMAPITCTYVAGGLPPSDGLEVCARAP